MTYEAWVAADVGGRFVRQSLDRPPLGPDEVEIAVEHCGVCHSDLSMWQNEWGISEFPAVLGHEVVGRVTALGSQAKGLSMCSSTGIR